MGPDIPEDLRRFEIPGRVTFLEGNGDLPKIEVATDWSSAEIYLLGAQVTDFQKRGEPPLLFLSRCSRFAPGQPIRGGIPIIIPWFGAREGAPAHGFARTAPWQLHEATAMPAGGVSLRFGFPGCAESAMWPPFSANYVVTISQRLVVELILTNTSPQHELPIENCLHSYFTVGDVTKATVAGLKGVTYLDKVEHFARKQESSDLVRIESEVDRCYLGTAGTVEILDPTLGRRIRVEKSGSNSTVLWNPWQAKAQQMPDFGNEEYQNMLCVESGNIVEDKLVLKPGSSASMKVVLSTSPLQ